MKSIILKAIIQFHVILFKGVYLIIQLFYLICRCLDNLLLSLKHLPAASVIFILLCMRIHQSCDPSPVSQSMITC